ncbi:hypothetical protein [Pinibacter soli]|uniref:DUF3872 domain-containing protein n=1 Tax=Pinibacter soli TaxID=3044211 RepID=A0ABT6RHT3_9BACT|nr:hypothetical protein [Pinibacter soli]MDI3322093.1 hypothetical protein [Pinibacter soli]
MKLNITAIAIIGSVALLFACNKDNYKTKPTLKITNQNTAVVGRNQNLVIEMEYTDKQGDISHGLLYYYPDRLNQRPLGASDGLPYEVLADTVPLFDVDWQKGKLQLTLDYNFLHRNNDTAHFPNDTIKVQFWLQDRGGNISDTIISDQAVILSKG